MTRSTNLDAEPKHQVMVTLDEEIYEHLKEIADTDERSVASLIRRLIKKELAKVMEAE